MEGEKFGFAWLGCWRFGSICEWLAWLGLRYTHLEETEMMMEKWQVVVDDDNCGDKQRIESVRC